MLKFECGKAPPESRIQNWVDQFEKYGTVENLNASSKNHQSHSGRSRKRKAELVESVTLLTHRAFRTLPESLSHIFYQLSCSLLGTSRVAFTVLTGSVEVLHCPILLLGCPEKRTAEVVENVRETFRESPKSYFQIARLFASWNVPSGFEGSN